MIENPEIAGYVSDLFLDIDSRMIDSLARVEENCSPDEFEVYRHRIGHLVNSVFEAMLEPLYRQHPSLKPLVLTWTEDYLPVLKKWNCGLWVRKKLR